MLGFVSPFKIRQVCAVEASAFGELGLREAALQAVVPDSSSERCWRIDPERLVTWAAWMGCLYLRASYHCPDL